MAGVDPDAMEEGWVLNLNIIVITKIILEKNLHIQKINTRFTDDICVKIINRIMTCLFKKYFFRFNTK